MEATTITIIGLGRTGASVGLALQAADMGLTVIGHDKERDVMSHALEAGAIDKTELFLVKAARQADIIVLALPATEMKRTLEAIGRDVKDHALILGLSALKAPSQQWANEGLAQGHYVGAVAVPASGFLGKGEHSVSGAHPDLFRNSVWCVMPAARVDPDAVKTAVNFGVILGAKPFFLDPAEYDSLMHGLHTIPGLAAAALFQTVARATGWRDMLRFAGSSFALATDALRDADETAKLALHDKAATLRWLDSLLEELQDVRAWVADGSEDELAAMLRSMGLERDKWLQERAQNTWQEESGAEVEPFSLVGMMIGRRPGRKKKDS